MSWLSQDVLLDLGTASTLLVQPGSRYARMLPTVAAMRASGASLRLHSVGEDAARLEGRTPRGIILSRPVQGGLVHDVAVAEAFLKHLFHDLPAAAGWQPIRLLATLPAGASPAQRRLMEALGRNAGAREVHLIHPAVATAAGARLDLSDTHLIADHGAGSTSLSLLHRGQVIASRQLQGGDSLTHQIGQLLHSEHNLLVGRAELERVKRLHGFPLSSYLAPQLQVSGVDSTSRRPARRSLASGAIAGPFMGHLRLLTEGLRGMLSQVPREISGPLARKGVLLTGQGAEARGLARMLQATLGAPIVVDHAPQSTALRGLPAAARLTQEAQGDGALVAAAAS
ncbi:MAG: rod shape-determining protein [Deltaproteobacteria bacterium]|nr:rod shape-determining protein [Deltaproteobacteria bacterium]